jgi:hypothetical protein
MSPELFRFYLTSVDPLEYAGLLLKRTLFAGTDLLSEPYPITARAFRKAVQHYAVQILAFPFRRDLSSMPEPEFRDYLYGWLLRTLGYFEHGRLDFLYHVVRAHFGDRHPESKDRFQLTMLIADDLAAAIECKCAAVPDESSRSRQA